MSGLDWRLADTRPKRRGRVWSLEFDTSHPAMAGPQDDDLAAGDAARLLQSLPTLSEPAGLWMSEGWRLW